MKELQTPATQAPGPCRLVPLRRVDEARGSLCVAQVGEQLPFEVARVYFIFDVPPGGERAHHAHREQYELLVAATGGFRVHCDDGATRTTNTVDSPHAGLLLPPMVFHHLDQFTPGAVCLVLSSGPYDPSEYVTDYAEFRALTAAR